MWYLQYRNLKKRKSRWDTKNFEIGQSAMLLNKVQTNVSILEQRNVQIGPLLLLIEIGYSRPIIIGEDAIRGMIVENNVERKRERFSTR